MRMPLSWENDEQIPTCHIPWVPSLFSTLMRQALWMSEVVSKRGTES